MKGEGFCMCWRLKFRLFLRLVDCVLMVRVVVVLGMEMVFVVVVVVGFVVLMLVMVVVEDVIDGEVVVMFIFLIVFLIGSLLFFSWIGNGLERYNC